ncbi:galactose mutarotase [Pseudoalteromonas sp. MMG010]|uniref:aldose epimerase family protein n=1 Tax=Pseudoalteromonas sp. MMG010 TaxID=2822685 RepID=UPI001B39DC8D|nr:aldose epimerase family protein [Pseudoalteromonas sp. MMG010]MBQ4832597.1 galactose mutarotase [Pseudoalteromonas sp. MMG010]
MTGLLRENKMQEVHLTDGAGLEVCILPFGATIKSILWRTQEMTLSVADNDYYLDNPCYLGATVGRFANRIAKGRFTLAGKQYQLAKNNGTNCLHGGLVGFNKVLWQVIDHSSEQLTLFYRSPDGDQGFPGNVDIYQHISVDRGKLSIRFSATSDAETVINLTNHCYFNLDNSGSMLDHVLQVNSNNYLAVDENAIPKEKAESVVGSAFDFTNLTRIADALSNSHQQLTLCNGIDHCYIFENDNKCTELATLSSLNSGVTLTVSSTQPGLQVYTGNYLEAPFLVRQGICLEAQNWPDAPNRDDFPTASLKPNEEYCHTIVYAFS